MSPNVMLKDVVSFSTHTISIVKRHTDLIYPGSTFLRKDWSMELKQLELATAALQAICAAVGRHLLTTDKLIPWLRGSRSERGESEKTNGKHHVSVAEHVGYLHSIIYQLIHLFNS